MNKCNSKKGIVLVEMLVASFVFTVVLTTLIVACNLYLSSAGASLKLVKSAYIAEEEIEAVKTIRDGGWSNIASLASSTATTSQNYYLFFNATTSLWQVTSSTSSSSRAPEFYGDFDGSFTISNVKRTSDSYHRISNGTISDPNTKLLTAYVTWQFQGSTTTKSISTYIVNLSN